MKKGAIVAWGIADRNNKVEAAKKELSELHGIIEGEQIDTQYVYKIKSLTRIVSEL